MIQHDDAVRNEFLDAVPGELVRAIPLGGNDGGQSFLLEPVEQAADFSTEDPWIWQLAEERFDGIQDDSFRSDPRFLSIIKRIGLE